MLFSLIQSLQKIILSLSLALSCGLNMLPAESIDTAYPALKNDLLRELDYKVQKILMEKAEITLSFPELNYSVPVTFCPLEFAQFYVDEPNMAAMFQNTLAEEPGQRAFEIGDHVHQGFDIINDFRPGMEAVINFNGRDYSYICTGIDKGARNAIDCLEFSDGSLLEPSFPLGIYTCNVDGKTVTLCCFEPIDN